MKDDGNCLFRGIAMECFGSQSNHLAVRHQVVEYMVNNDEGGQFSMFVNDYAYECPPSPIAEKSGGLL